MRIVSSPKSRIAAGLLFAVLLSVVGYQVVPLLNSHGPDVLLKRADDSSRQVGAFRNKSFYLSTEEKIHPSSGAARVIAASTPTHISNSASALNAPHDSLVGLTFTPDSDLHASILST
jgi:hypothetical protein